MKKIVLWLQAIALMLSASTAMAFTLVGDPREIGADVSIIPYWDTMVIEKGDTISKGCEPFLANVASVTPLSCWRLVAAVNNLESFTIAEGGRLLLPSSANTEAEVKARLDAFTVNAETSAYGEMSPEVLARDPLGMASEIRRALVGLDLIAKEIAVLETEIMATAEIEEMVTTVVSNVEVTDKVALTANVETAITAAQAKGSLTAYQVSAIITTQLALAGLSETAQQRAIVDAQTVRLNTLEATQKAQAETLSAHSTALEGLAAADVVFTDRVETLEQQGSLQSWPVVMAIAISLLTLLGVSLFARRTRRVVTDLNIAVNHYQDRVLVVETGMTSRKAISLPSDLETSLANLAPSSVYHAEVSVGEETYVVTFEPVSSAKEGQPMVTMQGVKDQTQSVHIDRVRSVLLKAGGAGRLLSPKPPAVQLVA